MPVPNALADPVTLQVNELLRKCQIARGASALGGIVTDCEPLWQHAIWLGWPGIPAMPRDSDTETEKMLGIVRLEEWLKAGNKSHADEIRYLLPTLLEGLKKSDRFEEPGQVWCEVEQCMKDGKPQWIRITSATYDAVKEIMSFVERDDRKERHVVYLSKLLSGFLPDPNGFICSPSIIDDLEALIQNWPMPSFDEASAKPSWNAERNELSFGGKVIKRYRRPAENQTLILESFEEQGWPEQIDDPLERGKLHDTMKGMRRTYQSKPITFERAGNGKAIRWKLNQQR